jgi:hypothetical protein
MAGYILGRILTEHPDLNLADHFPALNRKPFNCRPCLTFHLIWTLQGTAALILKSPPFFSAGLGCAFSIFMFLYINAKDKTDE